MAVREEIKDEDRINRRLSPGQFFPPELMSAERQDGKGDVESTQQVRSGTTWGRIDGEEQSETEYGLISTFTPMTGGREKGVEGVGHAHYTSDAERAQYPNLDLRYAVAWG